jgi:hypothetical protein
MGYESHFEVPDIDDSLLRGVDDLTDLLCPDSHPEDYTNRVRFAHHHQETNPFQPHQFQPVHVPVHVHGATFAPVQTGLPTPEERARQSAKEIRQARKQVRLAAKGKQLLQLKRKAARKECSRLEGKRSRRVPRIQITRIYK